MTWLIVSGIILIALFCCINGAQEAVDRALDESFNGGRHGD